MLRFVVVMRDDVHIVHEPFWCRFVQCVRMIKVLVVAVNDAHELSEERLHSSLVLQRSVFNAVVDQPLKHAHIEIEFAQQLVVVGLWP
jgi:hypothetical protein